MKYLSTIATCSALLATTVSAHGGVTSYSSGSTTWAGWSPYNGGSQVSVERRYDSYNPLLIADLSTDNIRCNNADITGTGQSATIAAGAQLTAYWLQWTHAQGCVMVYMAKCPSTGCNSFVGNGAVWFKIDQVGLINGTVYDGSWGPGLIEANLKYTTTIPASLPAGEYLIRHELLALHQANNPQFYPECAQLIVTGGGSGTPSPLVSLPGAYSGTDPAVNMNIYSNDAMTQTSYTCPGPAVWPATGGSTGGSTSSKTTTTAVKTTLSTAVSSTKSTTTSIYTPPPSTTTSKTTTTTTTTVSKTSSAAAAGQTLYGQCGGTGWTGPTTCASGTCKANGAYYSQCSP